MKKKKRSPRQHAVCQRVECGLRHSVFAPCADGFRRRIPFQRASSSEPAVATPPRADGAVDPAAVVAAEPAKPDLALITDPVELAKYMPIELANELATRRQNERLLADHAALESATGQRFALPAPLRKKSPAAAAEMLSQLERIQGIAKRDAKIPLAVEAQTVHDTLVRIPQKRQDAETAAREAAAPKPHVNGSTEWTCVAPGCGKRFQAASREIVQRKSKAEPTWQFRCPHCQSPRVMLYMAA
jgi:hypothetical protein